MQLRMGCISSKPHFMSSFQEQVKHRRSSANSIHDAIQQLTNHFPAVPSRSCSSISMMHILLNNKPSKLDPRESRIRRSRSCGSLPENDKEETQDRKGKSFHTVEEYDGMIQQISRLVEEDTSSLADNSIGKAESELNDRTKESPKAGKGLRRKLMARSLESLEIPLGIEFPIVGPEAFNVTPKFGSYCLAKHTREKEEVFDPHLVAHFEHCMQQLEAETQAFLYQISDKLEP